MSTPTESKKHKTLPHEPGFKWVFFDFNEHYDERLLRRFYNDLMIPNFPIQDELDPLEKWIEILSPKHRTARKSQPSEGEDEFSDKPDFHVLLVIKLPEHSNNLDEAVIYGGVVFEYYAQANVGLLTYLLVATKARGLGLGTILANKCRELLEMNAKSRGHLAGCNAIFLETNSATKVQESEDVMAPAKRHEIFYKMGLRLVDFDYVQAPLFRDKKKVNFLLLCCFITEKIPKIENKYGEEVSYYLPSTLLKNTMRAFWANSARITGHKFAEDVDYKRMMDQLNRREKIALLDLPWERPFTIVDLREHFDLELVVQFYQDMLLPCFSNRKDGDEMLITRVAELDPLETWITMLSPRTQLIQRRAPQAEAGSVETLHVLVALKYSEDEEENTKPMIAGGLAFEYYPSNNCGLLTYLLTPPGERGSRMARALIDQAVEVLDQDARLRGHLGGCNVIFMETSPEAESTVSQLEVTDITQQHALLEKLGWKLLDFDYVQPPFQDPAKKKAMNLMVFVTSRIPKLLQEESQYMFLPRSTVKNFIIELWTVNCNRLGYDFSKDPIFRRMVLHLERREKIPLLSRSQGKPWSLVDLSEDYDLELMKRFYRELIEPHMLVNPSIAESMEDWLKKLSPEERKKTNLEDHHALVAIKSGHISDTPILLGGLTFKYFIPTNCGLLTCALVKNTENREAVAKALVERAVDVLDQNAVSRGHLVGCNATFLETREARSDSSEDISQSHVLLEKMGWRLLDFNYVRPPLRPGTAPIKNLLLSVFLTPRIPRTPYEQQGYEYHYLPKPILKNFMEFFWKQTCASIGYDYDQDPDYVKMTDLIERRERIPLLELPWERPWTLLDLWEDYDVELLYKFYQNFYVPCFPDKGEREPLSNWLRYLTPEAKDDPNIEDFHILLAVNYPQHKPTKSGERPPPTNKPVILGGLLFTYYNNPNAGLITFCSVSAAYGAIMARALIEEATEILVENAISRGHIAGCNAIFLEASIQGSKPTSNDQITFVDHEVLYSMGWRMLNVDYVQPPLSIYSTGGHPYLLLALQTSNIPKEVNKDGVPTYYVPKELVISFLRILYTSFYSRIGKLLSKDKHYSAMMKKLATMGKVLLLDLPWKPLGTIELNPISSTHPLVSRL